MPDRFYLTSYNIATLISALQQGLDSVEISPDLNFSQIKLNLDEKSVVLAGKTFTLGKLIELQRKLTGIILVESGRQEALESFNHHYYKLRPTQSAPTIEIDGIKMHRTLGIDPWEDSRIKASYVVNPGNRVLDTCGGLGYTAIWALKLGASKVVSCEINHNIIRLRSKNPYSQALNNDRIELIEGDIIGQIDGFRTSEFDAVIHDPPRFSLAGELYSLEFYDKISRVLKPKGKLFHYTGNPYSKGRGKRFIQGIVQRLNNAGFKTFLKSEGCGVIAINISADK